MCCVKDNLIVAVLATERVGGSPFIGFRRIRMQFRET